MADQSSAFDQWFVKSSYQEFVKQEGLPMYEGRPWRILRGCPWLIGKEEEERLLIPGWAIKRTTIFKSSRSLPGYELLFMPGQQKNRQKVPAKPYAVAASPRDRTRNGVTLRLEPLDQSG